MYKPTRPVVREFSFSQLPSFIADAVMENSLQCMDNWGMDYVPRNRIAVYEKLNVPTTSRLNIVVLCKKGKVFVKVNEKALQVMWHQVLFITEGATFEISKVTDDFQGALILAAPGVFRTPDCASITEQLINQVQKTPCIKLSTADFHLFYRLYDNLKIILAEENNPFRAELCRKHCEILVLFATDRLLHTYNPSHDRDRRELLRMQRQRRALQETGEAQEAALLAAEQQLRAKMSMKEKANKEAFRHKVENFTTNPRMKAHTEFVQHFIDLVKLHYMQERTIQFYAARLSVSPRNLSNIVLNVTKRTASDWIDEFVVNEIIRRLHDHNQKVKEIADALNFPNHSFFTRYFKARVGNTPLEFRRKSLLFD